ncbi:MAG TPA: hypothetical protein VK203_01430 [Nostocaceae cyanobacterium]|nr:hypothetical protein [Nostocaceae cyanobacterium]
MSTLPPALQPAYSFGEPNENVILYEGEMEIEQDKRIIKGNGSVYLKWFPYPQIEFQLSNSDFNFLDDNKETYLKLPEYQSVVKVYISRFNQKVSLTETLTKMRGISKEPIVISSENELMNIKFHLTNFDQVHGCVPSLLIKEDGSLTVIDRIVFEVEDWRVKIDNIETIKNTLDFVSDQGGYGITHIGQLERIDNKSFVINEAREFLKALSYFLSFARGFLVSPTLLVGYDQNENVVWQEWNSSNSDPWKAVDSWAWGLKGINLVNAFLGFYKWWKDWGESAQLVIYWYLQSNKGASGVEGSIILAQAALEILAWFHLVEKGSISQKDFNQEPFKYTSQKINKLLDECNIPNTIPLDFTELAQFSQLEGSNNNGPYAFCKIRNNFTHAAPENRQTFFNTPSKALKETWTLGRWYIEMVLLKLFDYNDVYCNRLANNKYKGDLEPVPWK